MKPEFHVGLYQFVFSLSQALDLINPAMANHHRRVAYIALRVAEAMELAGRAKEDVIVAAALHDIGALSTQRNSGEDTLNLKLRCSRFGYQLLQKFKPFQIPARIVRFHNVPWAWGENREVEGQEVPLGSHIVNLANIVSRLLDKSGSFASQAQSIRDQIAQMQGQVLMPEHVQAFLHASANDAFWLDIESPDLSQIILDRMPFSSVELNLDGLLDFAELLAQVIDFRSRFTATHSSGVAASASTLAQLFGFPAVDCKRLLIAGYLHDIGKLAIPTELLDKNGSLNSDEWNVVRGHPYYTYRILSPIEGIEDIALWCGSHHERLCGTGYPFRAPHEEIPLESRILAVADVFTAVTENRPYRTGLDQASVVAIFDAMVNDHALDANVVNVLKSHYAEVDHSRAAAQSHALQDYKDFMEGLAVLDLSAARAAHLAWKQRLRAHLDGKQPLAHEQLVDHRECDLGRWYYGEGLHYYGHLAEVRQLEEPHAAMHELIHALVEHQAQGRRDDAEACLEQVEPLSRRIVELLKTIERKAAQDVTSAIDQLY